MALRSVILARQEWRLGGLGDASSIDRSQINLKQGLVLLALLLVLLSQPDDLSKDLRIEAVALRLLIDFLLAFVQFADFLLDVLDAFDDGAQLITRTSTGPPMVHSR